MMDKTSHKFWYKKKPHILTSYQSKKFDNWSNSLWNFSTKMLFRYYLLLLLQGLALSNSAKLNGGLAFSEADKNGQIYVNLNRFLATRTADTNILNHISSLGMDIVNRYYAHCNQCLFFQLNAEILKLFWFSSTPFDLVFPIFKINLEKRLHSTVYVLYGILA